MPKKRTRQKRKAKKPARPVDADGLRQMADELQSIADNLCYHADSMEQLGVATIEPLIGNYDLALEKLKTFAARQVFAKVVAAAARLGRDAHALFDR